jgi:ABC-type sugar transport system ATPase subunit
MPDSSPSLSPASTPIVRLRGVVKSFGTVQANRGADLEVARGENHALFAENGPGKSTMMR